MTSAEDTISEPSIEDALIKSFAARVDLSSYYLIALRVIIELTTTIIAEETFSDRSKSNLESSSRNRSSASRVRKLYKTSVDIRAIVLYLIELLREVDIRYRIFNYNLISFSMTI